MSVECLWFCGTVKLVLEAVPSDPLWFHTFQGSQVVLANEAENVLRSSLSTMHDEAFCCVCPGWGFTIVGVGEERQPEEQNIYLHAVFCRDARVGSSALHQQTHNNKVNRLPRLPWSLQVTGVSVDLFVKSAWHLRSDSTGLDFFFFFTALHNLTW